MRENICSIAAIQNVLVSEQQYQQNPSPSESHSRLPTKLCVCEQYSVPCHVYECNLLNANTSDLRFPMQILSMNGNVMIPMDFGAVMG